jgi:hypothetical protein
MKEETEEEKATTDYTDSGITQMKKGKSEEFMGAGSLCVFADRAIQDRPAATGHWLPVPAFLPLFPSL